MIRTPTASTSTDQLVAIARVSARRVRTIERNLRLGLYHGRNSGMTADTRAAHKGRMVTAQGFLIDRGDALLAGLIEAEHKLSARLSEARDNGQERPELAERLRDAQRRLRDAR